MAVNSDFRRKVDKIISSKKISHAYLIEVNNCSDCKEEIRYFINQIFSLFLEDKMQLSIINQQIDDDNFINLKWIKAEGVIKKEELINLKQDYNKKSFLELPQVYVIEDASKLTPATANSVLKFLEEPEEGIIAILLANNRYNVIDTIVSRCQIIDIFDNNFEELSNEVLEIISLIENKNAIINFNKVLEYLPEREVAIEVLKQMETYYYRKIRDKYNEKYVKYVLIIEEELSRLTYNLNYKLWLDTLLIRFMEV